MGLFIFVIGSVLVLGMLVIVVFFIARLLRGLLCFGKNSLSPVSAPANPTETPTHHTAPYGHHSRASSQAFSKQQMVSAVIVTILLISGAASGIVYVQKHQSAWRGQTHSSQNPSTTNLHGRSERAQRLLQTKQLWEKKELQGIAAEGTRDEALRTVTMLQQLSAQEERLWKYLEALHSQQITRHKLVHEQRELEKRMAEHRRQLEQLNHSINTLRPQDSTAPSIQFQQP